MTDRRDDTIDAVIRQAVAKLPRPGNAAHPSEDEWARFAGDEMSSDERAQVADHIVGCADCAAIFQVLSLVAADARAGAVAHRRPALGNWRMLAAAAAVVLTIGLSAWWVVRAGVSDDRQRERVEAAPPVAATTVTQFPSWAALPAAPEVRLPPDLILTMRGGDGDRDGIVQRFGEAIAPYRAGQFVEAAAALAPVAARYPDVPEIWFYLGTARLYGGAEPEAIVPLQRAQSSQVVGEDARWLHAVALQRAGRDGDARTALQALCSAPGVYQERACAVVTP